MTTKRTAGSRPGKKTKRTGRKVVKPPKWALQKRWLEEHGEEYRGRLLQNIKAQLPKLKKLLREADAVFMSKADDDHLAVATQINLRRQAVSRKISDALRGLLPDRPLRRSFWQLVAEGTDQEVGSAVSCLQEMGLINAFVHAEFFLEIACRKGRELETLPDESDTDWGALLKLFDLR